jgi:hypothetical protein
MRSFTRRRIPGSRGSDSRFFARHGITTFKKSLRTAERKRADAGFASKPRRSPNKTAPFDQESVTRLQGLEDGVLVFREDAGETVCPNIQAML